MARDFQDKINKMVREKRATVYGPNMQPIDPGPEEPVVEKSPEDNSPPTTDPMAELKRIEEMETEEMEKELTEDMKKLRNSGFNVDVEDDSIENEEAIFSDLPPEYREEPKSKKISRDEVRRMKVQGITIQACQKYAAKKGLDIINDEVASAVFWQQANKTDPNATLEDQIKEATRLTLEKLGKTIPYDRPVSMGELIDKDRAKQKYVGPSSQGTTKGKEEGEQPKTLDSIMDSVARKRTM